MEEIDSRPLGTMNATFINEYGDNNVVQFGPVPMPTYVAFIMWCWQQLMVARRWQWRLFLILLVVAMAQHHRSEARAD